ncbi:uncharacterized protein FTJAE_11548 [Fusarium tjaetaba]|uniref:Uncharacterized protein n=1 Tax=Fusarium tjaetaba TaxID=1567544 RepID=A0A8H5VH38_9HYPO|nr:uncharacterized protein FTJAE_11548 [Fusarium tjaetaba]KAF5620869.1 hypothetical protein FTJAE_11548 [Fusarium tjaetaba]
MALNQRQVEVLTKREDFGVVSRLSGESKASLSSQYRWENIVMPAPVALNALGACAVATGSQTAKATFIPPREGFKYLSDFAGFRLQANLSKCVDLGRFTFMETDKQMGKINMLSEAVYGKFENILEALSDPEAPGHLLIREMEAWNYASRDCLDSSKEMDGKFKEWINHASELHQACVTAEPTSEDQQVLKDIESAVAGASIDYQQNISTNQLEKSLEASTEAFKRASDGLPKDWDIVGRQIVEKLVDSLTAALNQSMPVPSTSKPKDANDPAYSQVVRDLIYWELLSTVFLGTTDGIAWDKAGQATAFAAKMLAHSQKSFGSLASSSEPSQRYKSALDSACKIANGIAAELEQAGKSPGYTAPNKDSDMVKSWQRDFLSNYATVITMNATAKSFSGSFANGSTAPSQLNNTDTEIAQVQAQTAPAQAVLESAKTRLHTASEALAATRETYQNSTSILVEQQERLNQANSKLERLKNSSLEMNAIKGILVQAIATMLEIKTEVVNLVRFFSAISVAVKFVTEKYVNPYVDAIKAGSDGDKVGPYSMLDFKRSCILNSTTIIRSYFSAFADYASMWARMSQMSIFPMLRMVDELSSFAGMGMDSRMVNRKAGETQEFSRRALDENSRKAKDGQSKTIRNMDTRVSETNEKKQTLGSVPSTISAAISSGVENSKRAAEQGLRTEADQSLLAKSLTRGN